MTSLALQLKRLAVPQAQSALGLQDQDKKSLLFDAKEASTLDKETFYAIGVNGFQELQNIDPSFIQFEQGLFDDTSKSIQRAVQTQDVNKVLNQRIQAFLSRMSPYFLLRPAQKALEWLIYRFHVHKYNVDDVLRCVLPYHESKIFVRIVQMLDIKEPTNKWHWLFPLQAPGVPLSKTTLINHCYKDIGFLNFVCDTVSVATQDPHSTEGALRTTFAFYTSTIVGAIEFASPLTENFIAGLAPYLIEGAKNREFLDYNAATYMIISQLCLKATLKGTLLDPLIQCISKHIKAPLCSEALSCIALVCQTQSLKSLPKKSFKYLCQVPSLVDTLQQLSQAHDITPLLSLLLTKLVHTALEVSSEGGQAYDLLTDFLSEVQLSRALACMVCRLLLKQYIKVRKDVTGKKLITKLGQKFSPIVQSLGSRYCESMDTAITSYMSTDDREPADRSFTSEFVQLSVVSSKHQMIGTTETSLVLGLNHASPAQRIMAVEHLRQIIQAGDEVDMDFIKQSVLERLNDDNLTVVSEVLKFEEKLCDIIPPIELIDTLQAILMRWQSKTKKSWLDVGLQVLTIITNARFWSNNESSLEHRCAALVVPHLFLTSGDSLAIDRRTIQVIMKSDLASTHPLLQSFSTVYAKIPSRLSERTLSDKTKDFVELLASNLAQMETDNQQKLVDVLLDYCHTKQARMAAYRALVATLLTRALSHVNNANRQFDMAQRLLGLLEEDLKKISDPEFKLCEGHDPTSNPPPMDHAHATIPDQYHAHMTRLLTSKRKMLRIGAVSLDASQVEILFWCMGNIIVTVKCPKELKKEDKNWWTVSKNSKQEDEGLYLTWLLRIFDLLTQGAADSCLKKDPERFRNLIKTVLEHHLSSPPVLFKFFSLVWASHCQGVGDTTYRVSALYQARLLHMGSVSIKVMAEQEVKILLDDKSTVVPALLLALSSELYPIRQGALSCLRALQSGIVEGNMTSPYWLLVKTVVASGQELVNDVEHLQVVIGSYFGKVTPVDVDATPSRRTRISQCLAQILHCISGENTAAFIQQSLLAVLSQVDNKVVLTSLLGMLSDLLLEAANPDDLSLDKMKLIHHIISHFTPKTAECLEKQSQSLELYLLLQALSTEGACHGLASPQDQMLKQITPVLYATITSPKVRQTILAKLIDLQVDTKSHQVAGRIGKVLKKLMLDAQQIVHEMNAIEPESTKTKSIKDAKKARIRSRSAAETDTETSPSSASGDRPWQRIAHILEHLQQRKLKRLHNVHLLVPALFNILAKCMDRGQEGEMEYIKHLIFTIMLTLCNKLSPDNQPIAQDILNESQFNVELIVKCIRTSDDPQTHNHALLLLATAAGIFPEHVLHSTMSIFTFMGASVLRKDDSYSFQVITKTIDSVIPALMKASEEQSLPDELKGGGATDVVTMVMRVFVDALPHTPVHRRLPIFTQLMRTIGGERHLWRMLGLLVGSYATKGEATIHPGEQIDSKGAARSMEFWLVLCEQFEPGVRVSNLIKLLKYISTLPEEKDEATQPARKVKTAPDTTKTSGALFDVGSHTDRHLRQFKFAAISFLPQVLSSQDFVEQMLGLTSGKVVQLNEQFQSLLEETLCYITQVAHGVQHNANKPTAKFWKALLHRTYEVLDKVNALLPTETFIQVVSGLLDNPLPTVRRKAMELLNNKLMTYRDYFADDQIPLLLNLRQVLCSIATCGRSQATPVATATPSKRRKSAAATTVAAASSSREEVDINRQTALYSLKLMCKVIGQLYPREFQEVLDISVKTLKEDGLNPQVGASAMLCLAETICSLQAHAISYLPVCVPLLLTVLTNKHNIVSSDLHLLSAVTSLQKIVETLPNFLSPYLLRILSQVTRFSSNGEDERSQLNLRLKAIRHRLATTVSPRVLLPAIAQGYEEAAENHSGSIGPLMSILGDHMGALDKDDLNSQHNQIVNFYLMALDYRAKHTDMSLEEVGKIEGHVIDSLVTMVMKLSESSFRPMYLKICDWAGRGTATKDRLLTLYRLSDSIADNLKGLFCLFAGYIIPQCAELLNANNTANTEDSYFGDDSQSTEKSCTLLRYIMDCLYKCFLHDKSGFVTKERFDCLLQPLADQIENMQGSESDCTERIADHLTPCMAQLLVASHDSASWQPLNYQVLLKTRHSSAQVRIGALTVLEELHSKLAEDYLSLLPETIPFLAELMEDESEEVEEKCQEIVGQLEKTLGEPLQKYF